jgi:hypothetical protein
LEGQCNVDEGGDDLDGLVMLGVVEEVTVAGLEVRIPFEYFEGFVSVSVAAEGGGEAVLEGEGGGSLVRGSEVHAD